MRRILWVASWIFISTVICRAQTTVYFPEVIDGPQPGGAVWSTLFVISNPGTIGSSVASGSLTLTQSNGSLFTPQFFDITGNPIGFSNTVPFQLTGGQTLIFTTAASPSVTVGFGTLTSNAPVTAAAVFSENICGPQGNPQTLQGCNIAGQAVVPSAVPLGRQAVVVINQSSA